MYLSRLLLDKRLRAVNRAISDCQQLHRVIMSAFPQAETGGSGGTARATFGVLFRVESSAAESIAVLYVQSHVLPDWTKLPPEFLVSRPGNPSVKNIGAVLDAIQPGRQLRFRLVANPTRKVKSGPEGPRPNGRRLALLKEEEQYSWLARKGEQCGFAVVSVTTAPSVPAVSVSRGNERRYGTKGPHKLTFGAVQFDGYLHVTDVTKFREALKRGIGSGKAFGFGLLSIAPA